MKLIRIGNDRTTYINPSQITKVVDVFLSDKHYTQIYLVDGSFVKVDMSAQVVVNQINKECKEI